MGVEQMWNYRCSFSFLLFTFAIRAVRSVPCGKISNCVACRNQGCNWCVQKIGDTYYGHGCVEQSDDCSKGDFGSHDTSLNNQRLWHGFHGKVEKVSYEVAKTSCTTLEIPHEMAKNTCLDCLQNPGYGWCQISTGVTGADLSKGGVCLKSNFAYACDIRYLLGKELNISAVDKSRLISNAAMTWATDSCPTTAGGTTTGVKGVTTTGGKGGITSSKYTDLTVFRGESKNIGAYKSAGLEDDDCSALCCSSCSRHSKCQWCQQWINFSSLSKDDGLPSGNPSTFTIAGVCRPAGSNCEDVKFGTTKELLNLKTPFGWLQTSMKKVDPDAVVCNSVSLPKGIDAPDCQSCLELGEGFGFCNMGIDVELTTGLGDDEKVLKIKSEGGICLPKSLAFFCNQELLPNLAMMLPTVKLQLGFATKKEHCLDFTKAGNTVAPQGKCEDNYSCRECNQSPGGQCSWCGGLLNIMGFINMDMFGKCQKKKEVCDFKIGTLSDVLKSVQVLDFKNVVVDDLSDKFLCDTIKWPLYALSPTRQDCVKQTGVGWCSIENVPVPPGIVEGNKITGGICLPEEAGFICKLLQFGDVQPVWTPGVQLQTCKANSGKQCLNSCECEWCEKVKKCIPDDEFCAALSDDAFSITSTNVLLASIFATLAGAVVF